MRHAVGPGPAPEGPVNQVAVGPGRAGAGGGVLGPGGGAQHPLVQRVLGGPPGQVHPAGFRDGPALALVTPLGALPATPKLRSHSGGALRGSAGSAPVSRSAPRAAPPPPLFCLLS